MRQNPGSQIAPVRLRDLSLGDDNTPPFVSAASGLVRVGSRLYVVADDALDLAEFDAESAAPGRLIPLLLGALPADRTECKRLKPDFEALVHVPASLRFPAGALMALGSGSTEQRHRGVIVALDASGAPTGAPRQFDLSPLHRRLQDLLPELNLEGAAVSGGRVLLFHRGNITHPRNFMAALDLEEMLAACLDDGRPVDEISLTELQFGSTGGVPFTVTDAAALPHGRLVATVTAEDTADSYRDGACIGGGVALLAADGGLLALHEFVEPMKAEGVAAKVTGSRIDLLLVTDADDPAVPAGLYSASVPLP